MLTTFLFRRGKLNKKKINIVCTVHLLEGEKYNSEKYSKVVGGKIGILNRKIMAGLIGIMYVTKT